MTTLLFRLAFCVNCLFREANDPGDVSNIQGTESHNCETIIYSSVLKLHNDSPEESQNHENQDSPGWHGVVYDHEHAK
ncbi:hypothetical protein B9Z55_024094 [Caenorhabditis nigoni]|uniref:Secreted protein n=1 Tax=Caenorhabditis nigoni TaxID=1611254 RepID=A0A2G5ST03_9PELO|nr:hypothetical protein B9Z55_024094 [Caenorhabditis nigoni]